MQRHWGGAQYDAIVVGAGLSGLAAAIRLRQQGKSVLVLEKTDQPGGRARKVSFDTLEFEVGCNQLGKSIHAMMDELGVRHDFIPKKNRFVFSNKILEFPLTTDSPDTLPELSDLFSNPENLDKTLEELTYNLQPTRANVLRAPFAYFLMRPSEKIDFQLARNFLINDYGYEDPRIPAGGMSALIDSMVKAFQSLGGVIQCDASYEGFYLEDNLKMVMSKNKHGQSSVSHTHCIVSSVDGWNRYPGNAERSLAIGSMLFEMNADFHYPEDVHTIVFVPDDIDAWLRAVHQGILDDQFAFHCFINQPLSTESNTPCKISAYLFMPHNHECNQSDREKIEARMISVMNQHLPGFQASIVKQHFFPPDAYLQSLGFESVVVPRIPPKEFSLSCYDAEQDIYYIGNAVNAEHEQHIEGALLSAKKAVDLIINNTFVCKLKLNEVFSDGKYRQY